MHVVKKTGEEIPVIHSPTKEYFICASPGTSFTVHLQRLKREKVTYAPKLYIDGKTVAGFKTMRGMYSKFHGFKMGGGMYREFLFGAPSSAQDEDEKEALKTRGDKFGTIIVKLFDCIEVPGSTRPKRNATYIKHVPLPREDNKKFFYCSVNVREGEPFTLQSPQTDASSLMSSKSDLSMSSVKDQNLTEHIGCFDEDPVDYCEIKYMDFVALQIVGILHISNPSHLRYVEREFLQDEQYLAQVIRTILENSPGKSFPLANLPVEFKNYTGKNLSEFYPLTNSDDYNLTLFRKYPESFSLSADLSPMLKLQPECLRQGKYPINFPKEYFSREMEKFSMKVDVKSEPCGSQAMEDVDVCVIDP